MLSRILGVKGFIETKVTHYYSLVTLAFQVHRVQLKVKSEQLGPI